MRTPPMWKPKWSDLCPCASGKKHRDCCWQRLPGFAIGKGYAKALNNEHLERALLATRADVTQYTIWHKSHTAPVIESDSALKMVRIDVDALGEYVGRLSWLYFRLGLWKEWLAALERLRANIQHPWWDRKIAFYRALYHLAPGGDRTEARRELAKAGQITIDEDDLDLLHLYVDLEFDHQPFAARLAILERILSLSSERENQLQYRGAKAIQYLLIGDTETAQLQLSQVIDMVQQTGNSKPLEGRERHLYVRLLQLLGNLKRDKTLLKASVTHFHELLLEGHWTDYGKAAFQREIGDSYRYLGEWDLAERAYRDAIALNGSELDKIHVAECLLYQQQLDGAAKEIDTVKREMLPRHEFEDFVFAYAAIAIWSAEPERLTEAKSLLQHLASTAPLFNERRLNLLVRVTETIANGKPSSQAKTDSTPEGGIATVSNFFLLEPNIAGIGINLNAIINYFLRKKPKEKS